VFIAMSLCAVVSSAFMAVVVLFQMLGSAYILSPALAVWMPLILFVPIAVEMGVSMNK